MKLVSGLLGLLVFSAVPVGLALAQQAPPPAHQPGVASPSASSKSQTPTAEAGAPPSLQKPDPAKDAAVRQLMEVTQTNKLGENITAAITGQVKQVMGRAVPPDQLQMFMDTFSQKFTAAAPASAVTDAVVPVYASHFTLEQIQDLIKFYGSPLGQALVKAMPQVTQESEAAGIQIDQKAAITVLRSMQDQYPQLKQMLPPEPGAPGPGAGPQSAPQPGQPGTPSAPPAAASPATPKAPPAAPQK
jgi:hypothetical protein